MRYLGLILLLGIGCSRSDDSDDKKKIQQNADGTKGCTLEAQLVCVKNADGSYQESAIGRSGPQCEFPKLPNQVEASFCADKGGGIGCTEDALIVCVKTDAGGYEQKGLGRSGPKCEFVKPANQVDDKLCSPIK